MSEQKQPLDTSSLKAFENAAAGHDGVLSDESGELIIKPCTDDERDFYQQTLSQNPEFAELMPTFIGTLQLGAPAEAPTNHELTTQAQTQQSQQEHNAKLHGAKISTKTAIVLENLEHGFTHPTVLDLKLGARLYAEGTHAEKAARLDKVASETTSGTLNFRIAGMKVWNGSSLDIYDKFYGRKFTTETINEGFATFFAPLQTNLARGEALSLMRAIEAEITKVRNVLESLESRMYGASVLVVYEGDEVALRRVMERERERLVAKHENQTPTTQEGEQDAEEEAEEDDADEDLEDEEPVAFKVKMIDFAHAKWTPGSGPDENVIKGLRNIESQTSLLISTRFTE